MKSPFKQILFWTPRIISILFAVFVSIFALDVFGVGYSFAETIVALLMHLIPTAILVIAILIAWRWEWLGGVLFIGFGLLYILMSWGRFPWPTYLVMAGPSILVGGLFLLNWFSKDQQPKRV